jgi:hypothetical protein
MIDVSRADVLSTEAHYVEDRSGGPTTVGRRWRRGGQCLAALALVAGIGLGAAGCSTGDAGNAGNAAQPSTAASTATDAPSAEGTPPATPTTPADDKGDGTPATPEPPLPNTINAAPVKVLRPGQPDKPTVTADKVSFSAPAKYGDNTVLTITKASKQVETGNGPGVFAGREFVKFDLELTNGSGQPINLNSVVVTTYYGGSNQLAAPVYTPSAATVDFGGDLASGAKATASYGFAVPTSELGNVTMVVDFDGVHSSATFSGAVTSS